MINRALKAILPDRFIAFARRLKNKNHRKLFGSITAQQAFSKVYLENYWGGSPGEFFSGSGSRGSVARLYCDFVSEFVDRRSVKSIIDFGCGDFHIGKQIAQLAPQYIGVDVVPALIERNRKMFGSASIRFECLDIAKDEVPAGDLCLIRQVLQHLSNAQIKSVLAKLSKFRYVLITEHQLRRGTFHPNKDKPHGPDTRLVEGSSVVLDAPPFSLVGVEEVFEVEVEVEHCIWGEGEVLATYLLSNCESDRATK